MSRFDDCSTLYTLYTHEYIVIRYGQFYRNQFYHDMATLKHIILNPITTGTPVVQSDRVLFFFSLTEWCAHVTGIIGIEVFFFIMGNAFHITHTYSIGVNIPQSYTYRISTHCNSIAIQCTPPNAVRIYCREHVIIYIGDPLTNGISSLFIIFTVIRCSILL